MENYINDLVTIDAIADQPEFFWLRDFKVFLNVSEDSLAQLDFNDQIDAFLVDPVYGDLHRDNIVLDKAGTITASRCRFNMDNVNPEDVNIQIDAILDQRMVSKAQPINQGEKNWSFFTYDSVYNIWEFYSVCAEELTLTTIVGVVAVTGVAFLLIPHWTAAFFVLPLICVLYIDLLGVMQWFGIRVNAVSYIALVMSIGLLVDYIMHVLLRYYESAGNRKEKTVEMLKTMGSSILIGGISTFLGILPLAFSSSEIFTTIFLTFLGLVTLGCGHGLILVPVILSTIGPEDEIRKVTGKTLKPQASTVSVDFESNA
jgi:Niemann-Pick C1 protein